MNQTVCTKEILKGAFLYNQMVNVYIYFLDIALKAVGKNWKLKDKNNPNDTV